MYAKSKCKIYLNAKRPIPIHLSLFQIHPSFCWTIPLKVQTRKHFFNWEIFFNIMLWNYYFKIPGVLLYVLGLFNILHCIPCVVFYVPVHPVIIFFIVYPTPWKNFQTPTSSGGVVYVFCTYVVVGKGVLFCPLDDHVQVDLATGTNTPQLHST